MLIYGGQAIPCDTQPVSSGFFNELCRLNEYITPHNLGVELKYEELKAPSLEDTIYNCWKWVANEIKYVEATKATLTMPVATDGKIEVRPSTQHDLWAQPYLTLSTRVGNCFNKSVVLASLLRNVLPDEKVSVVLGNVTNDGIGGHCWIIIELNGETYLLESTRPDIANPFVIAGNTSDMYQPVTFISEKELSYIPERKVKEPLGFCCLRFLADYLNKELCTEWVE